MLENKPSKTILITGTSSGLGKVMAEYLSDKGYTVIGTSRNIDRIHAKYDVRQLDITDNESINRFFESLFKDYLTIDVLINNAGSGIAGPLENSTIEETKHLFETNFFGVMRMNNKIIPRMKSHGGGLIIQVSSMAGLIGLPFQGHYSATKFALEGYTASLRMELAPFNIHVTNLNPGDFRTGFTDNRLIIENVSNDYQLKFHQLLSMYEYDERNGSNPIKAAKLVHRLIKKRANYKIRYVVGNISQTIGIPIKRWIGDNLFEKILKIMWKI